MVAQSVVRERLSALRFILRFILLCFISVYHFRFFRTLFYFCEPEELKEEE